MKVFQELNGHVYAATKMLFFFSFFFSFSVIVANICIVGETTEASCYYITFFCKCF